MDARELGNIIVEDYGDYYSDKGITISAVRGNYKYSGGTTISAIDAALMPEFVKLLNNWVNAITSNDTFFKKVTKSSLIENTFYFSSSTSDADIRSIDLCDFIDQTNNVLPDGSKAKDAGKILRNFMTNNLIIAHRATGNKTVNNCLYNTQTHGLAIYMLKTRKDQFYDNLIFARDSHWNNFMREIWLLRDKEMREEILKKK